MIFSPNCLVHSSSDQKLSLSLAPPHHTRPARPAPDPPDPVPGFREQRSDGFGRTRQDHLEKMKEVDDEVTTIGAESSDDESSSYDSVSDLENGSSAEETKEK